QGTFNTTLGADEFGSFFPYAQLQLQKRFAHHSLEGSLTVNANDSGNRPRGERIAADGTLLRRFKHEGASHDLSYSATGVYEGDVGGGRLRLNTRAAHFWSEYGDSNRLLFPGGSEDDLFHIHGTSGELGARYTHA